MKTSRILLAAALIVSAAACSSDVTAPDAARAAGPSADEAPTTPTTATPTPTQPVPVEGDGGYMGSGGGK